MLTFLRFFSFLIFIFVLHVLQRITAPTNSPQVLHCPRVSTYPIKNLPSCLNPPKRPHLKSELPPRSRHLSHPNLSPPLTTPNIMSSDLSPSTAPHGEPTPDMCCLCSYEDITTEDGNYCEYLTVPSNTWSPCLFETSMVTHLLSTQFQTYMDRVKKTDCQAELRRLLAAGPPVYISDKTALPVPEGDTHVERLWFASDDKERSAR